jgi:hypothetical protein
MIGTISFEVGEGERSEFEKFPYHARFGRLSYVHTLQTHYSPMF